MSIVECRGQISKAMRELSNRWSLVRDTWNDSQADAFQQQYLHEIEALVRKAVSSMDHMNAVLNKTINDSE